MKLSFLTLATALLVSSASICAAKNTPPVLITSSDGQVLGGGTGPCVHFVGNPQAEYDITFERRFHGTWQLTAPLNPEDRKCDCSTACPNWHPSGLPSAMRLTILAKPDVRKQIETCSVRTQSK